MSSSNKKVSDIEVPRVDVALLREQRDSILSVYSYAQTAGAPQKDMDGLDGVINLLDSMLDIAEGYALPAAKAEQEGSKQVDRQVAMQGSTNTVPMTYILTHEQRSILDHKLFDLCSYDIFQKWVANDVCTLDVASLQSEVIKTGNPWVMEEFALGVQCAGLGDQLDIPLLQDKVIEAQSAYEMLLFARCINGADADKLGQAVLDTVGAKNTEKLVELASQCPSPANFKLYQACVLNGTPKDIHDFNRILSSQNTEYGLDAFDNTPLQSRSLERTLSVAFANAGADDLVVDSQISILRGLLREDMPLLFSREEHGRPIAYAAHVAAEYKDVLEGDTDILCAALDTFQKVEGLAPMSADEQLAELMGNPDTPPHQIKYLSSFIEAWDAKQDATSDMGL